MRSLSGFIKVCQCGRRAIVSGASGYRSLAGRLPGVGEARRAASELVCWVQRQLTHGGH